ncbi:transposase [Nocardia sp. CA-107356]|uniref:transposase n=1 Tax=Nocardia sp. CA-107356 TaxID=3239972 RepID=UPI003D8EEE51
MWTDAIQLEITFKSFDANRIWVTIVALALDLTAGLQTISLHGYPAQRWEPKTLRLQLFSIPARIFCHARRIHLRLSRHHHGTGLLMIALDRLQPD